MDPMASHLGPPISELEVVTLFLAFNIVFRKYWQFLRKKDHKIFSVQAPTWSNSAPGGLTLKAWQINKLIL